VTTTFPAQSPLYYANNRDRYERQNMIKTIEEMTNRRLIVYVSNFNHPNSGITHDDIAPFAEVCFDIQSGEKIDLLIHSPGGDPNAAEQLVNQLLARSEDIRVIVPLSAKSAATMICLVADTILMSDSSELGPIDPQIPVMTPQGYVYRPAKGLLNGLEKIKQEVIDAGNNLNPAYYPILQGIDAALIDHCEKSIAHSKNLARKWLQRSMYKHNEGAASLIAEQLVDIEKYPNHGAVINWQEARSIGLEVTYYPPSAPLWEAVWRLFCMYDVDLKSKQLVKFFEGRKLSVCF
jgi:hypothetical protein